MRNSLLIIFPAILFFAPCCMSTEILDVEAFRKTATTLRTVWDEDFPAYLRNNFRLPTLSQERITETVDALKALPKIGDNGTAAYLLSQYKALTSHNAEELLLILQEAVKTSNIHMYPGWWHPNFRYTDFLLHGENYYYIVFPLKTKTELWFNGDINWVRYPYPMTEFDTSPPLSLSFSRLGLYDLAWRVQMEEGTKSYDNSTVFGETFHSYYLRAADNAYRTGKKELAWSFLMNAAVFEDERSFEPAIKTAQLWLDIEAGKAKLPKAEIVQGEERKRFFLEIVERYQKMNAHPRAWLFMSEYKNEFDNPERLTKAVQDDWLELMGIITQPLIANKIVMYGVHLYPDGANPLSVELPWAFPEGSIEKLKEQLGELAKIAADGFRRWMYDTGDGRREECRAKLISLVNDVVTLEKEDGSKVTVEFSLFNEAYQDYIRRLMGFEKYEKETGTLDFNDNSPVEMLRVEPPPNAPKSGSIFIRVVVALSIFAALIAGAFFVFRRFWV